MPRLRFGVACLAFLISACGSFGTLGPTPLDEGVILYIHADFVGSSQQVNSDVTDFGEVEGPCVVSSDDGATATWDDCISSIRVLPGWRATLYRDSNFRGSSIEVTEDLHDLTGVSGPCHSSFNDCASSIRVSRR
jgi:hypothetical protein